MKPDSRQGSQRDFSIIMNTEATIRHAVPEDAAPLVEMFSALYRESEFLLLEEDEFKLTADEQENLIMANSGSISRVLLVAEKEGKLVGFLGGTGGGFRRNRHSIKIAMGVLAEHQRQGFGRGLLNALLGWAGDNRFRRVELTVVEHNSKAKALYEEFGFEVEGLKQNALIINGNSINEYCMARLIAS